ncbi:MAG: HAD-IC family P-type ATPase [Ruminococcus sp.]
MIEQKIKSLSLSSAEVEKRISEGKINTKAKLNSKPIKKIIFDNTITLFNFLNLFLALLLLMVGSFKNMLFMGVVFCNIIIGIVQEIRSKKTVDKLSIVVSDNIDVVRDGEVKSIPISDIVIDDIIILRGGNQIPSDSVVVDGFCSVNESLLTGESDLIEKEEGSSLMSGSFVSSGEVYAKVVHIGEENYATKIHKEATYSKKINSEIMNTLNKILTFCSIGIFPIGIALFVNHYFINRLSIEETIVSIVAALIGMIPEGLVLLTSTVLAVSVIRLAHHKVLVQQLFCIETLARVDVLCLDKTGTITSGDMEVVDVDYLGNNQEYIDTILKSLSANSVDNNATINAINKNFNCKYLKANEIIPFSSEKKWSGAVLEDGKSYVLGAAEFIYDKSSKPELFDKISKIDDIIRVVTLSVSDAPFVNRNLPENLQPVALVLIKDKIRENAEETINYFKEQGVCLKVISGDNNKTVEMIAKSVGITGAENSVDATTLDTDEKIKEAAEKYTVFGRVTPQQKKKLIVALKEQGHTVAMTGDGVNDVLALKEADCSVSIASGSDAAKNISQLVLVNDDFSSMPKVVAEGRRSINNIQRSASLFLVKTIYSVIIALFFTIVNSGYPFEPIHLSLVSAMTIGLPSFVLALQPNHNRIKGHFFRNVMYRSLPGGLIAAANIIIISFQSSVFSENEISTMSVIAIALVGVLMVISLSVPFNGIRTALLAVVLGGLVLGMTIFNNLFSISPLSHNAVIFMLILSAATVVLFTIITVINRKRLD